MVLAVRCTYPTWHLFYSYILNPIWWIKAFSDVSLTSCLVGLDDHFLAPARWSSSPTPAPWAGCTGGFPPWEAWTRGGAGRPRCPGCPDTTQTPRCPAAGWSLGAPERAGGDSEMSKERDWPLFPYSTSKLKLSLFHAMYFVNVCLRCQVAAFIYLREQ